MKTTEIRDHNMPKLVIEEKRPHEVNCMQTILTGLQHPLNVNS